MSDQGSSQNILTAQGELLFCLFLPLFWQILAIFSTILCLEPEMTA